MSTISPSETTAKLDISNHRTIKSFGRREQIARVLWWAAWPFFRFTPRPFFWAWRVFLLRLFGATIGKGARINPTAEIFMPWNLTMGEDVTVGSGAKLYSVGQITIGDRAMVSQFSHICAGGHDITSAALELTRSPIEIGPEAWVAADAFVAPGVRIGRGAVVAARAAVFSDVDDSVIVSGNPARPRGLREILG